MLREKGEQPLTKEPSKGFRQAVNDIVVLAKPNIYDGYVEYSADEATDRILALCKEMLVPDKSECFECNVPYGHCCCYVRNSIRQHLLKQLGE